MKKQIIYIFGNPLLEFDSLPLQLNSELQTAFPQIDFRIIDPNENIKPVDKKICLIDTVADISRVTVIQKIEQLFGEQMYSAHDFDLSFNLRLLNKLGLLDEILIFGVPMGIKKQAAMEQLVLEIEKYF